jgi:hypothetical protein
VGVPRLARRMDDVKHDPNVSAGSDVNARPSSRRRVDEVVIEELVQDMLAEREKIRAAAAAGRPWMPTIRLPDGSTYKRRQERGEARA